MRYIAIVLAAWLTMAAAPAPVVEVSSGKIVGAVATDGRALVFRAIPFAAPPLGAHRWAAPLAPQRWIGIRNATKRGPACLQNDYKWNTYDHAHSSEDCLTLDVRTPALNGKLPVMVWIHGGSNRAGSAGETVMSTITNQGIIVVAIQYRLGIFGFLAPRGAATADGTAGNYGLMVQIAALLWVRGNIARFGGDPANVTIAGESAGAQDVGLLLAAPAAQPFFRQPIMESGTPGFGMSFRSVTDAKQIADQLDGILATQGSISKLREVEADALLAADLKLHDGSIPTDDFIWLKTTVDGAILTTDPRRLLAEASDKPVLLGTNRAEFGPPPGSASFPSALLPIFGANGAQAAIQYDFGNIRRPHDPRLGHPELEVATDWIFRCPAGRVADLLAQRGSPVWRYEFDLPTDQLATHAGELRYVFDAIPIGPTASMQLYWANFVRRGNPNDAALPLWPRYLLATRQHIVFDNHGVTRSANLRHDICGLVDNI